MAAASSSSVSSALTPADVKSTLASFTPEQLFTAIEGLDKILIEAATKGAPDEDHYRLHKEKEYRCQGRILVKADRHWSIPLYHERQCKEDSDDSVGDGELCESCWIRENKYKGENGSPWYGRIHEDMPNWAPVLGTLWATVQILRGNLRWLGPDTITDKRGYFDGNSDVQEYESDSDSDDEVEEDDDDA